MCTNNNRIGKSTAAAAASAVIDHRITENEPCLCHLCFPALKKSTASTMDDNGRRSRLTCTKLNIPKKEFRSDLPSTVAVVATVPPEFVESDALSTVDDLLINQRYVFILLFFRWNLIC